MGMRVIAAHSLAFHSVVGKIDVITEKYKNQTIQYLVGVWGGGKLSILASPRSS